MICQCCKQEIPASPYDMALKEVGIREVLGAKDNPRIVEYHKETSLKAKYHKDSVAWCSAFVCWCHERVGVPSTRSAAARSWLEIGRKIKKPKEGDVVVFWRSSPKSWKGHVAFFVREDGDYIICLGGNQSNKVGINKYKKSRVLGYRRVL